MTSVHLVRHGETAWSLTGQHTGRTDLPLTEHGRAEGAALGARLRGTTFAAVFSSPRLRARQTCEAIGLGDAMTIDPDLAEWDYGEYEGLRLAEIRARRPDWDLFRDGCPGGELPAQVADRADRLIARLRAIDGAVAIVTHGHMGRVIGVRWNGLPIDLARHFTLATASLSILGYEHDRATEPVITRWNLIVGRT